jgi:hypothetical protein
MYFTDIYQPQGQPMAKTDVEMGGTDTEVQPPTPTQTQGGGSNNKKIKRKSTLVLSKTPK